MPQTVIIVWLFNIICDSIGQIAFKMATERETAAAETSYWKGLFQQPYLWLGFLAYGCEAFSWLWFLSLVPLSQGVMLGSFNIVVVLLLGRLFFGEKLNVLRVSGVSLITLGVMLVGWGV